MFLREQDKLNLERGFSANKMEIKELMRCIDRDDGTKVEVLQNIVNSNETSTIMPFLANYLNDRCITLSRIAEITKKSPQSVIGMIKRNKHSFPKAYSMNGTNLYVKRDVVNWLITNNKIAKDECNDIKQEFLYGSEKSIYFTGSPKGGKSTICVSAATPSIVPELKKILTAGGTADTENLIKIHFKRNSVNYVIFHYGEKCNDSIPIKIDSVNVNRIKEELKKCKEAARKYRTDRNEEMLIGTYVELVLEPNKVVSKLMNDCNIDVLTFIDTPGLDSNYSGDSAAMADIIVVVLGDGDDVENITKKIKSNVVPETGAAQYIYLYNNRFALIANNFDECDDVYSTYLAEAKEDFEDYSDDLKNLQDELVIGSALSACKPIDSLICVPNFSREPGIIEEFFFNKFCEKIQEALSNSPYLMELRNFDMDSLSERYLKLLNKHIIDFACSLPKGSYGVDVFKGEVHGRTKSLDNYRIDNAFDKTIRSLKSYFYNIFSEYKTEDCEDDEASIIRMVYLTINEGLMNNVQYGYGYHPWEDSNSPTQMICEEVLSKELLSDEENRTYRQILIDNNIRSNSWDHVYVNSTDWNKAKLDISAYYNFPNFETSDLESYIKVCHFIPSVLVQSVMAYYKMNPSSWNNANFSSYIEVINSVMENVQLCQDS